MSSPPDDGLLAAEYSDVLYALGHDLRAPVRAITGFAELLKEPLQALPESTQRSDGLRFLQHIHSAAERLQAMQDGLLAVAMLSQRDRSRQSVALLPLVQSALAARPVDAVTVTLSIPAELTVATNAALLRIALAELLDNAVKFSRDACPGRVEILARHEAGQIALQIRDNGLGFDSQYAQRLGVPFQTLHARPDLTGLGLGLAKVRTISRLLDLHWQAHSQTGQGAQFSLHFSV